MGEGLICALFFLGLKGMEPEELFYVNLGAASLAYILIFVHSFNLTGQFSRSSHSTAGVGASMVGVSLYALAVTALVVISYMGMLELPLALILHGAAIALLILFAIFTHSSVENVSSAMGEIEQRKESLSDIRSRVDSLEIEARLSENGTKYGALIVELREQIRYITPSDNSLAKSLEAKLAVEIQTMEMLSRAADADSERRWRAAYNTAREIIKLRKQQI